MSATFANVSIPFICDICQISSGFSAADRRSIIVLVVLTLIALIACYTGVLWFAFRTRYLPEDNLTIIPNSVYINGAFDDKDEEEQDDLKINISTIANPNVVQPVVIEMEDKEERF